MGMMEPVLMEFQIESAHTRKVLDRVPEDRFDWTPHKKSWTIGKLASHLAENAGWVSGIVDVDEMDLAATRDHEPFVAKSKSELMAKFDKSVAGAVATMKNVPEDQLFQTWRLRAGDKVLFEAPRIGVIKTMLVNHAIQHRGQLEVYLRLNDVPVPAIYGPSGDEEAY